MPGDEGQIGGFPDRAVVDAMMESEVEPLRVSWEGPIGQPGSGGEVALPRAATSAPGISGLITCPLAGVSRALSRIHRPAGDPNWTQGEICAVNAARSAWALPPDPQSTARVRRQATLGKERIKPAG